MYDFLLLSRDERTEMLFRGPWHDCIVGKGLSYIHLHSGISLRQKLFFICNNLKLIRSSKNVLVFGLIETLLYSLFIGNRSAYFVITGFGRSWLNPYTRILMKFFVKLILRNRRLAVLNSLDYTELALLGCKDIHHLHGEGHPRLNFMANPMKIMDHENRLIEFVFVGRLLKSKGILPVLDFLSTVNQAQCKINFTCYGDQDFNNSDSLKISDVKQYETLLNKLHLMGHHSDPWMEIDGSAVYISGSKREGLPFSVLEALHAGLYCVLTDVPGHTEFLEYPGVAILGQVSAEDLLVDINKWYSVPQENRLKNRHEKLMRFSSAGTKLEKCKFLQLDKY